MRHPVLPGVAERGERLMAQATGRVLALSGPSAFAELQAAPSSSADTVTFQFVLCAVTDVAATLQELDRVLAPGGSLLAVEHARVPGVMGRVQDAWSPAWQRLPRSGCRTNREPIALLRANGFAVVDCDRFTARGVPILSHNIAIRAVRKAKPPTKEDDPV